jgi:hypothetical protein
MGGVATFEELRGEVDGLDVEAAMQRVREIEGRQRRDEAELGLLLTHLKTRKAHKHDGHATIFGWLRASLGWSDAECRRHTRIARLIADQPVVGESLFESWVSVANIASVARAHANPRCTARFSRVLGSFLYEAERSEHHELRTAVDRWVTINDPLARHRHAASHHHRTAHFRFGTAGASLTATWGALDAARNQQVFEKFLDSEFQTDWAAARATHGEQASAATLTRTAEQRAADALSAIFRAAAAVAPGSRTPITVTNLHVDWHTFEEWMFRHQLFPERHVDPFDDPTPLIAGRRCETGNGTLIDPDTMMRQMLEGYVRFIVLDDTGVPIKMGRTRRLFTGAARDAVISLSDRCTHPGCRIQASRCQADHLTPWCQGGETDPSNGGPKCGTHNRLRNHGYISRRDRQRRWHTHRPDGSEIQ